MSSSWALLVKLWGRFVDFCVDCVFFYGVSGDIVFIFELFDVFLGGFIVDSVLFIFYLR